MAKPTVCLVLALVLAVLPAVWAGERSMPAAELFFDTGESFYGQPGGNTIEMPLSKKAAPSSTLVMPEKGNEDGCKPITTKPKQLHFTFVISRGSCSFETKAAHAEAVGASGVVVYNTLGAMYDDSTTSPGKVSCHDFDCSLTREYVHKSDLTVAKAYNFPSYTTADTDCDSGVSGLTGKVSSKGHESCCLLDGYLNMSVNRTYTLLTVYVNMENGRKLLEMVDAQPVTMQVATRSVPSFDPASFMIWGVGVITCLIACHQSAEVERRKQQGTKFEDEPFALAFGPGGAGENVDIDSGIAVGFMMFASFALLGLFFAFKYAPGFTLQLVVAGYCMGAVGSVTNVLLFPFFRALCPFFDQCIVTVPFGGGRMSVAACISTFSACCLATLFFFNRTASWSWILQDIISFSYCVMILQVAQLPNIKVSTVLLTCAFCYDIFFVFLSPLVFDSSVMIQVATGGQAGVPVVDVSTGDDFCEDFCNFHSESARCPDHEALPMLFRIPRMQDWRGGAAMLGLGDIVLPGLLLSFLLRYDICHAKKNKDASCGYFPIAAAGYAVGLMMANCAVYLMHMGQPALLYLVPCTLGTTTVVGFMRNEFQELWLGFDEPEPNSKMGSTASVRSRDTLENAPLKSLHDDY